MSRSRVGHSSSLPASGSPRSTFIQNTETQLQRTDYNPCDVAFPSNNEGTILHPEKLHLINKGFENVLGRVSNNLGTRDLTKHALAVRKELIKDLNAVYRLMEALSLAHKDVAQAIRSILRVNRHTKRLDTKSAGEQLEKASVSLTKARADLETVELRFKARSQDLNDTANLRPGKIHKAGNFVATKPFTTIGAAASTTSGLVAAALQFALHLSNGAVIKASFGMVGAIFAFSTICKELCPDAAAYAELPETKPYILEVANSLTGLINILEDIKDSWKHLNNDKLKSQGQKRPDSKLTPEVLHSILKDLDTHSDALDMLVNTMGGRMPVAAVEAGKNATLTIEPPRPPPPKAGRGAFEFLRGGSERKNENLGAYNMA